MEDAEVTYTLGFYPFEETFDGQFHKLVAVKAAGKSVDVRLRKGYFELTAESGPQPGPAANKSIAAGSAGRQGYRDHG